MSKVRAKYQVEVPLHSDLMVWLVRHVGFLLTRFVIKENGRTAFQEVNGVPYVGHLIEFGETCEGKSTDPRVVQAAAEPRTKTGIWVGRSTRSSEHILMTDKGIEECRTIVRRPEELRWDLAVLTSAKGLPWDPHGRGDVPTANALPPVADIRDWEPWTKRSAHIRLRAFHESK